MLLTFILVLARRRSVMGEHANPGWFHALATVCIAGVAVLALVVTAQAVGLVG